MGLSTVLSVGIPIVVKLVDRVFGRGGGKEKKLPAALDIVRAIVEQFAAPGVGLPAEQELVSLIQNAVDALNKSGELKGADTVIDPPLSDARLLAIGTNMIQSGVELIQRSGAVKGAP